MNQFNLNEKQMEIFRATWPNLGWAAREREEQLKELKDGSIDTDNSAKERLV
jgi:hypothetical protein